MKKPRKFYINIPDAIEILKAYAFFPAEMNWYQIRLKHQESNATFDWYHTQGTVVVTKNGRSARWKTIGNAEKLAQELTNYIYSRI
jgi:hypothetical protein